MVSLRQRIAPQPAVALVLSAIGAGFVWQIRDALLGQVRHTNRTELLLILALVGAAVIADTVTIQIGYHTKTILNKPDRLTEEEWAMMAQHPVLGANLLQRNPDFARGVPIIRHHHERIDGKGYPDGLAGTSIPFGAQVVAVADTWDALTSDRPYRSGMSPERAARILYQGRGTQWRADLVDALLVALGHEDLLAAMLAADATDPAAGVVPDGVASLPR